MAVVVALEMARVVSLHLHQNDDGSDNFPAGSEEKQNGEIKAKRTVFWKRVATHASRLDVWFGGGRAGNT